MRMAASTTAMPSGWAAPKAAIDSFSRRNTAGCTSAFKRARPSGWAKTRAARARRSMVPAPESGGVQERIQAGQTLRVGENAGRQGAAVDGSVGGQNLATEFLYHGLVSLSAGRHHRMADFIRLDQQATVTGQRLADKRFSAGDAARQPNLQHTPKRRSAEATVLTMSMAMVRGPTPPGTGVYAPAHSTTSMGSTSPTSRL